MSSKENCKSEDEIAITRAVKLRSLSHSSTLNKKDDNNFTNKKSWSKSRSISPKPKPPRNDVSRNYNNRIPEPCECIGVFGLSQSTNKDKLYEIFGKFGEIVLLNLLFDKNRNVSAGFAFITYKDIEIATKAKDECNKMKIDGNIIRVDYSIVKKAYSPTPGVYKGRAFGVRNNRRDERDNKYRERNPRSRERDPRRNRQDYSSNRDNYRNNRFYNDNESSNRHRKYQDRSNERRRSESEYRYRKVDKYDHKYMDDKEYKHKNAKDVYSRKRERSPEGRTNRFSRDDRVNKPKRKYSRSRSPVDRKYRR